MTNTLSAILLSFIVLLSACAKEDTTPANANNSFSPSSEDELVAEGNFVNKAHPTSGKAKLYRNSDIYTLSISDFSSDNGPDLRVYLSADQSDDNFVDLGPLQAISGDFNYTFSLSTDVSTLKNVIIWCEDFSINFGSAALD